MWISVIACLGVLAVGVGGQPPPVPPLGGEFDDKGSDGSYKFGFQTGDRGNHYRTEIASKENQVAGRFGARDPMKNRVVETQYTAGRRGFRAKGPNIARQMDLSQNKIPYNPPVSKDSPNYNPTYKGYHDPNENPSYKFGYRTAIHSKQEVSDSNGHVEGVYSFVDDIGERHDVRYKAGSGTGFIVDTAFPDSKLYNDVFHKGPPGKPGGKPRGRSSIQQKLDGSYQFIAAAPDHRRTEVRDNRGNVRGSYTFIDEKGLQRTVEYIAGPNIGYKVIKKGVGISFPPGPSFAPPTSFYTPFSPNFEGVDSGDFPAGGGSGNIPQQGSSFGGSGGAGGGTSGSSGSPFGGGGSQGSSFGVGSGGSSGSSGSPFGGGGSPGSSFGVGSGGSSGSSGSPFGGGGSPGSSFGVGSGGSSGSSGSPFGGGGSQGSSYGDKSSQGGSYFGGSSGGGSQGVSYGSGGGGGSGSPGSSFSGGGSQGTYGGSSGSTYGGSTTSRPFVSSTTGSYGGSSTESPFSRPPGPPSQGGTGSGPYGKPGGSSSYPTGSDPGDSDYSGLPGTTPSTGTSTVSGSTGFGNDFIYESSPETDIVEPFLNTPTAPKRPSSTTTEYPVSGSDYFGAGEGKPPGAGPGKEPPFQGYPGGRPQNSVSLIPGDLINNCCRPRPSSTSISLASTPRPLPNYEDYYLQSPSFNNDSPPAPPPFRPTVLPDRGPPPPDYPRPPRPPYSEFSITYDEANNGKTTFRERYNKDDDDQYMNSDKTYFRVPGPVRAHVQSIDLPYGSRLPNPGEALERGLSHNKQK